MGHHTFDADGAERLEDAARRYRFLSREELLWALDPDATDRIADLGSGTGFYTDDVAPFVDTVYAVDLQPEMHAYYREKGVPANVDLLTSGVASLPFDAAHLDGAVSTMTYHEFATDEALAELARVTRPGGRLVVGDWSADGDGEAGPPLDQRFDIEEAAADLRAVGFDVEFEARRTETFLLVAVRQ